MEQPPRDLVAASLVLAKQLEQAAATIRALCDAVSVALIEAPLPADDVLALSIDELLLPKRASKAIRWQLPAETIGELVTHTAGQLLDLCNFGHYSLDAVRTALSRYGLRLRGDPPPVSPL